MKVVPFFRYIPLGVLMLSIFMGIPMNAMDLTEVTDLSDSVQVVVIKGKVIDEDTSDPLSFANITVSSGNYATVSNSEGNFILKVPKSIGKDAYVKISYLGYEDKQLLLSELDDEKNKIRMKLISVSLGQINVLPKDAHQIIREMLHRKEDNYVQRPLQMTAFYRETIQKGKSYVSLAEAVVDVYKQPYNNYRTDGIKVFKARKQADYKKMDTLTFKLQGGPYSTLMLDVMKDPYAILSASEIDYYNFKIDNITKINDQVIYVIYFEQKPYLDIPMFYGKLYIDAETLALTSANYSINLNNKREATAMFIKVKPAGAEVYPTEANYMVNYTQVNGKWQYSYSRGQITFKINWKKKWFNTNYTSTIEMAVTNWEDAKTKAYKASERLKPNIILQDQVEGFNDPEFWGSYNVIEPEASIESVIKKIKRRLDKK